MAAALCLRNPDSHVQVIAFAGKPRPVRCTSWTWASGPQLRSAGPCYGSGAGSGAEMGLPEIQMRAPWR